VILLALAGLILDWSIKIGTKMETVKREGIDIVFAMDVSKLARCCSEPLRKVSRLFHKSSIS
jgi:hypothetical protein